MSKLLVSFLLFFVISTSVNAASGCIRASRNRIYTSFQSGINWKSSPFTNSSAGCLFIFTGAACTITSNGSGFLGDTVNPQQCPIDDYIWVMMIIFGGLGYFVLRKNALKLSIA